MSKDKHLLYLTIQTHDLFITRQWFELELIEKMVNDLTSQADLSFPALYKPKYTQYCLEQ